MNQYKKCIGLLLVLVSVCVIEGHFNVYIDVDTDLFLNWVLEGEYEYYRKGDQLKLLKDFLPSNFDYDAFHHTKGIWAVIPEVVDDNKLNVINETVTTSASFSYRSSAQLMSFVAVTYCISGDARINIKLDADKEPIFTIDPTESPAYKWAVMQVNIGLMNRFIVEAVVHGPKDFVFIDRIEGSYLEVTTTTTTRRTTTTTTTTTTPSTTTSVTTATTTTPTPPTSITTTTPPETTPKPTSSPPTPTANPIISHSNPIRINPAIFGLSCLIAYLHLFTS